MAADLSQNAGYNLAVLAMIRQKGHRPGKIVSRTGRGEPTLPVNFGDLFTVVAWRPY